MKSSALFFLIAPTVFLTLCGTSAAQLVQAQGKMARDLVYRTVDGKQLKLDLFLPGNATDDSRLPVVVWIHGGAWRAGSKENCPALPLVARGFAVVSIDYRLTNEAIFPAQIHDCKAAIRWLRANAGRFPIDYDRIGVWGSSAGGHLVALLGTSGGVADLEGGPENHEHSSRVQAVCDFFGPTDFLRMDDIPGDFSHLASDSPESALVGGPLLENREKAARANPITYVSADDPPFLIMHGDQDRTVPPNQSELLHEALKKSGVSVRYEVVKGAGHGFGADANQRAFDFFQEVLKPAP